MRIVREKIVTARVRSVCCACIRQINAGETMRVVVIADHDGMNTWKECKTCMELIKKDPKRFDDGFSVFEYGCVYNALNVGQTPEELLTELG
jgi:hypothetical protein